MFKINPSPTFKVTVPISAPGGESLALRLVFKHKSTSAVQEFLANASGSSDLSMLAEMVASVDPGEKPADQSDMDFLAAVVEAYPAARSDILRTYLRELTESRIKN